MAADQNPEKDASKTKWYSFGLFKRRPRNYKLPEAPEWDPTNVKGSLESIRCAVEAESSSAIDWYLKQKNWKSIGSRLIRMLAIILPATAGLVPLIVPAFDKTNTINTGLLASVLVGLTAAFFALDKAFGFSSSWIRYVVAAGAITQQVSDFRIDWIKLQAAASISPTPEQLAALIDRAKALSTAVQMILNQETAAWAKEYQDNAAQLDKDLQAKLDSLKKQPPQTGSPATTGSVEITVDNADQTDGLTFTVALSGGPTAVPSEVVPNSKTWTKQNLAGGNYTVTITAQLNKAAVTATASFAITAGQTTKATTHLS